VGERPGVSRLGVKEKEGATGGWRGRRGRGEGTADKPLRVGRLGFRWSGKGKQRTQSATEEKSERGVEGRRE